MTSPSDLAIQHLSGLLRQVPTEPSGANDEMTTLALRLRTAIDRWAPPSSHYRVEAAAVEGYPAHQAYYLGAIAVGLRDEYAEGTMTSFESLVAADLFSDFLEMAEELQEKGFKDPAAVLAGSVLEEHLRKLAMKLDVPTMNGDTHVKADKLNSDLRKKGAYNALEQKNVTAWLALRNRAAHGEYDEYDHAQVSELIRNVRSFLSRNAM